MNPDLESERSTSHEAHFKHAMIQMETGQKMADSPVLHDNPGISSRNVPDSRRTPPGV
jgi:hypothetical protein